MPFIEVQTEAERPRREAPSAVSTGRVLLNTDQIASVRELSEQRSLVVLTGVGAGVIVEEDYTLLVQRIEQTLAQPRFINIVSPVRDVEVPSQIETDGRR